MSPRPAAPRSASAQAWAIGVCVTVALESAFAVEVTATEDEDPSRVGAEPMDVEALPDTEVGDGDCHEMFPVGSATSC